MSAKTKDRFWPLSNNDFYVLRFSSRRDNYNPSVKRLSAGKRIKEIVNPVQVENLCVYEPDIQVEPSADTCLLKFFRLKESQLNLEVLSILFVSHNRRFKEAILFSQLGFQQQY